MIRSGLQTETSYVYAYWLIEYVMKEQRDYERERDTGSEGEVGVSQ